MRLAKDGLREILIILVICSATGLGAWAVWPVLAVFPGLLFLFVLYFFRDPQRPGTSNPADILSPADGKVDTIEVLDQVDHVGQQVVKIGIFLSVFNVHINRVPLSCCVIQQKYQAGKFLDARDARSSEENEMNTLDLFDEENNVPFRVRQIAGKIARRIISHCKTGDNLEQGARFGMIKFGSRTEIYLPKNRLLLRVSLGDKVKGGETVLGCIKGTEG